MTTASIRRRSVSVIIVSYKTRELTVDCLRSVFEQTRDVELDVVVVDNASGDGTVEAVRDRFPQVTLIALSSNIGFGRANNLAAARTSGDYILLLNPDTVILNGAIQELLDLAERHPNAGIWGGRTLHADGSLDPRSCWKAPSIWGTLCAALGLSSAFRQSRLLNFDGIGGWQRDTEREVDIVSGCFLLITRALWNELKGFHPDFFIYGEDFDLCLRARQSGARPMITPRAEIIHYGGASEGIRAEALVRRFVASARLFRSLWSRPRAALGVRLLDLWALGRAILFSMLGPFMPRAAAARAQWVAVWRSRGEWRRVG